VTEEAEPVSYQGVPLDVPVLSSTGEQFGTLDKVLQVPSEDLFDGVVVHTTHGKRFVDRDQIDEITTKYIKCDLDAAAVDALPKPDGAPVYEDNAAAVEGHNFHDWVGRTMHGGWTREK
jgi:hypothetical protein